MNSYGPHGLIAFDLDGTLLRGPTVCELLAGPLGRLDELWRLETDTTEKAVAATRASMASWYARIAPQTLLKSLKAVTWAPGAQEGVTRLRRAGFEVAIVSVTWSFAVAWFARQLGVQRYLGTDLNPGDVIRHVWPRDKGLWVSDLASELGVPLRRIAAIGDSAGDFALFQAASLRIFVGDAVADAPPGVLHLPGVSITRIAEYILGEWAA